MTHNAMVTRFGGALLALLLACATIAGCGASVTRPAGGTTVSYWAVNMAPSVPAGQRILRTELATFSARTGIQVDLQVLNWDDLYTKIMAAVAGGPRPDVIDIGNTWSPSLQETGAFLPFDEQAMTAIGGRDRFLATSMSTTGAPGRPPVSIPLYGQSYGLFYNTTLFARAGITRPPATWSELIADARRLTKPGQWGISLTGASAARNAHLAFIFGRQQGSRLFDADGRPSLDAPGQLAAVSWLVNLMAAERVINPSDAASGGLNDPLAALAAGRAAMVPFQSTGQGYLDSVDFHDYAVAPLPLPSPRPPGGADVRSLVAGTNLAVFADTDHRTAALQLVEFLTSNAEQVALNEAFGTLPVISAVASDAAFADPVTQTFLTILREHAETMPMVPEEAQMEVVLGSAIGTLWAHAAAGAVSTAQIAGALADANRRMTAATR